MMNKIKKFYSTKRVQKIAITLLVVIMIIGIAFITLSIPTSSSKASMSITLTSKDIEEKADVNVIANADIEIVKDKISVEKASMSVNKSTVFSVPLEAGEYEVHMTSAPIESDGSTYKVPSKIENIVISDEDVKNGETVNVGITLERIAVADMTKEQLEDTIARIGNETPDENKDLIEALTTRQEAIVSDETNTDDTEQESEDVAKEDTTTPEANTNGSTGKNTNTGGSTSAGSTGGSNDSNNASNNTSSNTGANTSNKHTHTWVPKTVYHAPTESEGYLETIPAVTEDQQFIVYDDGCKGPVEDTAAQAFHDKIEGPMGYKIVTEQIVIKPAHSYVVETVPAKGQWTETVGHTCSCGATK